MSVIHCPHCDSALTVASVPEAPWNPASPYLPLVREIASEHGYTLAQLQAPDRTPEATRARRAAMRAAQNAGASLREIARLFRRDHSTVLTNLRKAV
jgi:chromosomal replication initiation ATPase DnaA